MEGDVNRLVWSVVVVVVVGEEIDVGVVGVREGLEWRGVPLVGMITER